MFEQTVKLARPARRNAGGGQPGPPILAAVETRAQFGPVQQPLAGCCTGRYVVRAELGRSGTQIDVAGRGQIVRQLLRAGIDCGGVGRRMRLDIRLGLGNGGSGLEVGHDLAPVAGQGGHVGAHGGGCHLLHAAEDAVDRLQRR